MKDELKTYGTETKGRELLKYHCGYCEYRFKHWVGTSSGGKSSTVSTQVKCPKCGNFLKTFR